MTAAYINGCLAQIHDGNDGFVHGETRGCCCHPGRLVVPAALALGEALESSGSSILTAIATTYEALYRMREMSQFTRDILPAAIAAGKLLELTPSQYKHSFGFACHNALTRTGFPAPVADDYLSGIGTHVRNGVTSALLAHSGCCTGEVIFDDTFFIFDTDSKGNFADDLYFKQYTACRNIHASTDLILEYRNDPSFDLSRIDKINVYLSYGFYVGRLRLDAGTERMPAQLNIFYSLAAALHDGELGAAQYSTARRNDSTLHDWSRRIELKHEQDDDLKKLPPDYARVEIFLNDGTIIEKQTDHASWGPKQYPDDEERHNKFRTWSTNILNSQQADQIIDMVENLEKVRNIREVMKVLEK